MANLKNKTNKLKVPFSETEKKIKKKDIDKFKLNITKSHLVSKSGTLKKKTKHNLKLMNDILLTELMIERTSNKKQLQETQTQLTLGINNNDYQQVDTLQVQNVPQTSKPANIKTSTKKGKSKQKPIRNSIIIKKKGRRDTVKRSKSIPYKSLKKDKKSSFKISSPNKQPSKEIQMFECDYCQKIFHRKCGIRQHIRMHESKIKRSIIEKEREEAFLKEQITNFSTAVFQCDYCLKKFGNKSSLQKHIYIHLNMKPYVCEFCNKGFRLYCKLQVHLVSKHFEQMGSTEKYVCDHCDLAFLWKENLSIHIGHHTKGISFYKCAFCEKTFSNHFHLSEHERHHLKTSQYKCGMCDKIYDNRTKLAIHVKSHLNIKDFICQYCGKEFLRPNSIRRHVEICHSGFRIQCPICFKKLKGHLSEHLRTHENSKPHKCPDCGQRFTQSTQLTVHRRSHTGARPYSCRICSQRFSHSNAMLLHFRRHTGEKPFPCAMCPMSFSQLPHMKAHMRKIHGKTEAYKCQKCLQFFKLKKELVTHNKSCLIGEKTLSMEEKLEMAVEVPEIDSVMSLSRMRFLIALLLTMVASKSKLKCLGA